MLQRLRAKVEALQALRDRLGQIAVLDTYLCSMHYQKRHELPWAVVLGITAVRIILPICVIDELDNKKYTGSDRISPAPTWRSGPCANTAPTCARATPDHAGRHDAGGVPGRSRSHAHGQPRSGVALSLHAATAGNRLPSHARDGRSGNDLRADAHGLGHAEMPNKYAKDAQRRAADRDD